MLQLEFDYGNMMRTLQKMNFDNEVLICEENQIVLSNTKHGSTGSDFEELDDKIKKGYHQTVNLYGTELEVYVRRTGENAIANIAHNLPSILLLILINAILPFFFVHILIMQDILFNLRFQGICGSGDDCSSFECNKQRTDRQPLYVEQPHCIPDFRITASLQHRCTPIGNRCRKCSPCIPIPFLLLSPIHCNPCKPDIGFIQILDFF